VDTLKKNREFGLVYTRGKSFGGRYIALRVLPRRSGGIRVGFSVSKKVGGAVVRNKVRRRLKECMRAELPAISKNAHLIFIARFAASEAEFSDLKREMHILLKKSGLFGESK